MTSTQMLTLLIVLTGLLAVVSAVAGGLWWRWRARALVEVAHLADVLASRLRTLDEVLVKLDSHGSDPAASSAAPRRSFAERPRSVRIDPPESTAIAGPTLIAVPDLSTGSGESPAASAAAELARRFGAIWALADTGAAADAIARGTGQPIGQVELILGLRRQLEAASTGSRPS
jgi:hypothetical protein